MNVHFATLGCRLNEAEIGRWERDVVGKGHACVGRAEDAEIVVINTCAVTTDGARKSRALIRRLARARPDARVIVTGCWATLEAHRAKDLPARVEILANARKDELVEALGLPASAPATATYRRTRAFLKVQDGCRHACTYCAVTIARGAERSRPLGDLIDEARALLAAGYQELVLCGVHLGGYGSDLGLDLVALVRALLRETAVPRLRLSSLEPWELSPALIDLFADRRLCPHLHLPLQSGCDATLRRMARRGSASDYARRVELARRVIPDLVVSSDVMVGFPGETEAEWRQSLGVLSALELAPLHVFRFDARPGTAAARMADPIDPPTKTRRARELRTLAARWEQRLLARQVGTVRPVLWEGRPQPGPAGMYSWRGLTDTYLRVVNARPANEQLRNQIEPTRIVAVERNELVGQTS